MIGTRGFFNIQLQNDRILLPYMVVKSALRADFTTILPRREAILLPNTVHVVKSALRADFLPRILLPNIVVKSALRADFYHGAQKCYYHIW